MPRLRRLAGAEVVAILGRFGFVLSSAAGRKVEQQSVERRWGRGDHGPRTRPTTISRLKPRAYATSALSRNATDRRQTPLRGAARSSSNRARLTARNPAVG